MLHKDLDVRHAQLQKKYDENRARLNTVRMTLAQLEANATANTDRLNTLRDRYEDLQYQLQEEKYRSSGLQEALRIQEQQYQQQHHRLSPNDNYEDNDNYQEEQNNYYQQGPPEPLNNRASPQVQRNEHQFHNDYVQQRPQAEAQWQQQFIAPQQLQQPMQYVQPMNQVNDVNYNINPFPQQVPAQYFQQIPAQAQFQQNNAADVPRYGLWDQIQQNQQVQPQNARATPPAPSPQQQGQRVQQQILVQPEQQVQPIRIIAETSAKELNELDHSLIFRGKENTLGVLEWFHRLELSFKPEWDDAQKLRRPLKHL